jgi:hypothetical protein
MRNVRAFAETPHPPHRASLVSRIVGLPGRVATAVLAGVSRLRLAPQLDGENRQDDLWLLLLASDPDGVWMPWPAADRRPQIDDAFERC